MHTNSTVLDGVCRMLHSRSSKFTHTLQPPAEFMRPVFEGSAVLSIALAHVMFTTWIMMRCSEKRLSQRSHLLGLRMEMVACFGIPMAVVFRVFVGIEHAHFATIFIAYVLIWLIGKYNNGMLVLNEDYKNYMISRAFQLTTFTFCLFLTMSMLILIPQKLSPFCDAAFLVNYTVLGALFLFYLDCGVYTLRVFQVTFHANRLEIVKNGVVVGEVVKCYDGWVPMYYRE